jgi:hypothetical protein
MSLAKVCLSVLTLFDIASTFIMLALTYSPAAIV